MLCSPPVLLLLLKRVLVHRLARLLLPRALVLVLLLQALVQALALVPLLVLVA